MTFDFPDLETLTFEEVDPGVGLLRMNRPDRMNSQTVRMFHDYLTAGRALRDSGLRALIITGAGERAFCAGFDLDEISVITDMGVREFLEFQETATGGIQSIRHLPFPVIAAIHGPATGGGLALALAADIRLAAPSLKMSAAFVKVGTVGRRVGDVVQPDAPGGSRTGRRDRLHGAHFGRGRGAADRPGQRRRPSRDPARRRRGARDGAPDRSELAGRRVRMSKRAIQRNAEIGSYEAALELENRQALLTRTEDMPEALAAFQGEARPSLHGAVRS